MPTFRVTGGALTLASVGSNYPDNTLPGGGEIDNSLPGSGGVPSHPIVLPPPPPGVWPPPSLGNPIVPIGPDNTLPVQPGTIWPSPGLPPHVGGGPMPGAPARPDQGLPGDQPHPDQGLPGGAPPRPDQGLPAGGARPDQGLPSQTFWMLCYAPNLGWKYVSVDPSLKPGMPLPPAPEPKG